MTAQNLIPTAALTEIAGEARILDTMLAIRLGYNRPADIRELIARNRDELSTYGSFPCRTENPKSKGGRPGAAYWLNEGQALVLCALSRTPAAAAVRKALIEVFMAYRQGKLVHVKEHNRRPPVRRKGIGGFDSILWSLQAHRNNPEALLEVLAHTIERIDALEAKMA